MKLYTLDKKFIKETNKIPDDFTGIFVDTRPGHLMSVYFKNGKFHREDGPAVEKIEGNKFWYLNGKLHRLDGPACEYWNKIPEYYFNDSMYTESQHKLLVDLMKLKALM